MLRFENGRTVFVNSAYNTAEECTVVSFTEHESSTGEDVYVVNSTVTGGTFGVTADNVFSSKLKALAAAEIERQTKISEYKLEIKNLNDLLQFPLHHCLCGDEYTDWNAVEAYKARVKELTGANCE